MVDVEQALRFGRIREPAEEVRGAWRYRVHGATCTIAVELDLDRNEVTVVTVWKAKRTP